MKSYAKPLWYLVCFLMIQILVPIFVNLELNALGVTDDTLKLIIATSLANIVAIALFFGLCWTPFTRAYVQSRPWGVLFWTAIAAIGVIIPSEWLQEQMPVLPNLIENEFDGILRNRWGYFAVGIMAPIAEEAVFRGAILRSLLSSIRPWTAIALSALLFALIHMNPAQMPHAFLVGLLLGWIYWRTGSILPTILFHWVNNSVAYAIYNIIPQSQNLRLIDLFVTDTRVLLAVLFSLLILVPALYQLHLRMKRLTNSK